MRVKYWRKFRNEAKRVVKMNDSTPLKIYDSLHGQSGESITVAGPESGA